MRGGVLEPLDHDNMPLQAVIVKNGKIFVDSIDPPSTDTHDSDDEDDVTANDDVNDENKRIEEEIDRLTSGVDDDDDDYISNGSFSQEAFDSFMRASDNEDDQIMIYNKLQPEESEEIHQISDGPESRNNASHEEEGGSTTFYQYDIEQHPIPADCEQQRMQQRRYPADVNGFYHGVSSPRCSPVPYGVYSSDRTVHQQHGLDYRDPRCSDYSYTPGTRGMPAGRSGGCRRRDSLNLEEYSTFDEDVDRLLSEDLDASWRYVPLYPDTYYR